MRKFVVDGITMFTVFYRGMWMMAQQQSSLPPFHPSLLPSSLALFQPPNPKFPVLLRILLHVMGFFLLEGMNITPLRYSAID
jgi:hypothetical protein